MDPNAPSPSDPSLLGLATELILMIAEDLGPSDRFILSQTNRRLREIFCRNTWMVDSSGLPYHKRLEFWKTVDRDHPHVVVCRRSLRMGRPCLRRLDVKDIPHFTFNSPDLVGFIDPQSYIANSTLRRDHVRTALKLHRLLGSDDTYSGRILSAASTSFIFDAKQLGSCETELKYNMGCRFESKASIFHGRFLLRMKIDASGECRRLPAVHKPRRICPHKSWTFQRDMDRNSPIYRLKGSCGSCLTQYDIVVGPWRFSMYVWYDLGREEDEDDVSMRSCQIAVARR